MATASFMNHCGNRKANFDELWIPEVPEATDTYTPVEHAELAKTLKSEIQSTIAGLDLASESFSLSADGKKMFGVYNFKHDNEEMGLAVGFRNSYDKSMSVGIAMGAYVFVCDNMAFTGKVKVLRRHTKNVWRDLERMLHAALPLANDNYLTIVEDSSIFKATPLSDTEAYENMGVLYGEKVVSSRQLNHSYKKWHNPDYEDFTPRTMWSLYNAVNDALKNTPPTKILEKHIKLHSVLKSRI